MGYSRDSHPTDNLNNASKNGIIKFSVVKRHSEHLFLELNYIIPKNNTPPRKKHKKYLEIWFIVLYICDIKMILPTKKSNNIKSYYYGEQKF